MPIVLKSGSLNLLEPSGPIQACNGIAVSFIPVIILDISSVTYTLQLIVQFLLFNIIKKFTEVVSNFLYNLVS